MKLDKNITYIYKKYSYKNFTLLSDSELLRILEWRNHPEIKKCMNNTESISEESHLRFCHNLCNREDVCYWMIMKGEQPIGVLNVIDIDSEAETCEPGFYLAPDVMGRGESIFVLANYKSFLLNELGVKGLIGHNFVDNLPALIFTMFFGADIVELLDVNGRKSVKSYLSQDALNNLGTDKLISRYAQFLKNWNTEEVLKSFDEDK